MKFGNIQEFSAGGDRKQRNETPRPESVSELYRSIDLRLSAKLVPTFTDRGASRSHHGGFPYDGKLYFIDRSRYFSIK
jgi:hypothetical protein